MKSAKRLPAAWLFVFAGLAAGCATTSAPGSSAIDRAVETASARCGCRMGIAAKHLESGRAYAHLADAEFETASVIKIAILTEAIAQARDGKVSLEERWKLSEEEKADGSGVLLTLDPGLEPTWSDLLTLMIGPSDNTAADAWIKRLGVDAVNARMNALGFAHIRLYATIPALSTRGADPSPWRGLRLGSATPAELARWYELVAQGELLDAASSKRIFEYLDKDPTRLRAARRFGSADLWAGKSGTMSGVRNDSGILRTKKGRFVLVFLTDGSTSSADNAADHPSVLAIADAAKAIVDAWSADLPDLAAPPR